MSENTRVVSIVLFYFICSLSLVFLNKNILSGNLNLDAAVFLTWTQIVVTVVVSWVLCQLKVLTTSLHFLTDWEYKWSVAKTIMPVTLAFCGMVIFNNLCLQYVEVTFYQTARSLIILFNILISYVFYMEKTSLKCLLACLVTVIGYILGVDGEIHFSWNGVIYGLASSVFVSLYSIMVKNVMKSALNNDSWLLLYYNNMNSMFLLPLISLCFGEYEAIRSSTTLFCWNSFFLLILAGIVGTLMNIASFFQIKYTSALTHNVSGMAKACLQSFLAWLIYQNPLSPKAILGLVASILGSFVYGKIRYDEQKLKRS